MHMYTLKFNKYCLSFQIIISIFSESLLEFYFFINIAIHHTSIPVSCYKALECEIDFHLKIMNDDMIHVGKLNTSDKLHIEYFIRIYKIESTDYYCTGP